MNRGFSYGGSSEQESREGKQVREPHPAYSRPGPGDADTGPEEEEANNLHQENY